MPTQLPTLDFQAMAKQLSNNLAPKIAQEAKAFFRSSFDKGGFTDYGFHKWEDRKDESLHKILFKSHALRDSIRIKSQTPERIEVIAGEGIPYAEIHNKGGIINVTLTPKARKFFWYMYKKTDNDKWKWMAITKKERLVIHMPKRQYIGQSGELNRHIGIIIDARIKELQSSMIG